jgi:hypothetical protein
VSNPGAPQREQHTRTDYGAGNCLGWIRLVVADSRSRERDSARRKENTGSKCKAGDRRRYGGGIMVRGRRPPSLGYAGAALCTPALPTG